MPIAVSVQRVNLTIIAVRKSATDTLLLIAGITQLMLTPCTCMHTLLTQTGRADS
jgi:hypothetical protein